MQPLSFLSGVGSPASVRPIVLGHRGASHDHPENTLRAFREAIRQGADGVELDVMLCGSGEVVVVHDDTLARVAGEVPGSDQPVRNTPLGELRRFDVGQGERVPTLDEVFAFLGPEVLVNVELKSATIHSSRDYLRLPIDDGLARAVTDVLARAGRLRNDGKTLISSFDPFQLLRFAASSPTQVPLGFLFESGQSTLVQNLYRLPLWTLSAVHPESKLIDGPLLRTYRRRGLRVNTWTVDDPAEVLALAAHGVSAIITNRPGDVIRLLTR